MLEIVQFHFWEDHSLFVFFSVPTGQPFCKIPLSGMKNESTTFVFGMLVASGFQKTVLVMKCLKARISTSCVSCTSVLKRING